MRQRNNIQIDAILGEEFIELLEELGVSDEFNNGKYKCHICDDKVDLENVLIVFPKSEDDVGFICKKSTCFVAYKSSIK